MPTPAGPTPRQLRGEPLVQIEFPREAGERQKAKKASTAGAIHGYGWARQIEMNERKRNNLVNIITSLERAHA
jgi:hypothetical protein